MTFKLKRGLWLWAGTLAMVLLLIIPMTPWLCAMAIVAVIVSVGAAWTRIGRQAARQNQALLMADNQPLPPAAYRLPIVLVCGDGLVGLFGVIPAEQLALRITGQGCYVRVANLDQLPAVADSLMSLRPDWGRQLSVLFIVNPQEHVDSEVLSGRVRTVRHQLLRVRKQGIAAPLLVLSYLQTSQGAGQWFSWEAGQPSPNVREAGECVSLDHWQMQAADNAARAFRLQTSVQLSSAAAWLAETVLPHLASREAHACSGVAMATAITLVANGPQRVAGNLWHQWLRNKLALVDTRPIEPDASLTLPFPDPLLSLLPRDLRYSPKRRAGVIALWMFTAAALVALVNSAWQNTLLARQVSDDLRRYNAATDVDRREESLAVLRQDAERLDHYYRHGEPLSLGLGLYRGEPLRESVLAIIAGYRKPSAAAATTVRLDSLSLFSSGSAQLNPDSAKVLINALVGIKAQPGWLIVIAGHTDASGSAEHNLQLSRARAAAVHQWMKRMGDIPDNCFAVQGFGASQPIASNDTEAGRQANRRVDIRLIPDVGACVLPTAGAGKQPLSHNAAFTF